MNAVVHREYQTLNNNIRDKLIRLDAEKKSASYTAGYIGLEIEDALERIYDAAHVIGVANGESKCDYYDHTEPLADYIYIAGPMTGITDYNYPAFAAAAATLRAQGEIVLNPAENFDGDQSLPYHVYLRLAVKQVSDASKVVTLDGWEGSEGAVLEVDIARHLQVPVVTYESLVVPV